MKKSAPRVEPYNGAGRLSVIKRDGLLLAIGTVIFLIVGGIALGIVGFAMNLSTIDKLSVYRYCLDMDNSNLYEAGGGDSDGKGFGTLTVDLDSKRLSFDVITTSIGTPSSMHVRGPVTPADPLLASIFLPSDGSSLDVSGAGGHLTGSISITSTQGNALVDNPIRYYLHLNTDDYPQGSISSRLGYECRPRI